MNWLTKRRGASKTPSNCHSLRDSEIHRLELVLPYCYYSIWVLEFIRHFSYNLLHHSTHVNTADFEEISTYKVNQLRCGEFPFLKHYPTQLHSDFYCPFGPTIAFLYTLRTKVKPFDRASCRRSCWILKRGWRVLVIPIIILVFTVLHHKRCHRGAVYKMRIPRNSRQN